MLMRRNKLETYPSKTALILLVVVAAVLIALALKAVISGYEAGVDSITQTEEKNISLYLTEKQKITGQEAINVIGLFKGEKVRFNVATGAGSVMVYNYDGTSPVPSYDDHKYSTGDENYINPSGVFTVSISDNVVTLTQDK